MPRPNAALAETHHDEAFRLYESDNPKQKRALASLHIGKPHANIDPYLPQWRIRDIANCTGLLVSAVNAIGFRNSVDVRGVALFAPISVYLSIVQRADKRGQTVEAYIAAQNEAARRRNKRNQTDNTPAVLSVINKLTRNSPKARAAFEQELGKIGVRLPPLAPPATTNLQESPQ